MAATAAAPSTGPRYAPEDPTLPKPWRGLIDGITGYLYFWNPETNITQYERPVSKQLHGPPTLPPPPPKPSSTAVSSSVQSYHSSGSNGPGQQRDSRSEDRRYGSSRGNHHQGARGTSSNSQNNVNGSVGDEHGSLGLYNQGHATQSSRPSAKGNGSSQGGGGLSVEAYRRQHEITANGDNIPAPYMTFDSTGFPTELLREVQNAGFSYPTPIQAQAWPIALQSRDVVAIAKTGSGKTLGYLFPGFLHLARTRNNSKMGPTVLVLAPTRELATQILDEAVKFGRSSRISSTCVYGGAPKGPQLRDLDRGVDIVVATPGRLNDILEMRRISLRQVSYLVLDEADRMLDMGFEPQIRKIVKEIPPQRQTLMFTATWPKEVRKIAADFMVKPAQVNIGSIDELVANKAITQHVEIVTSIEKQRRLEQILRSQEPGSKIIIFCSTKRMCDQLSRSLTRQFGAAAIHGDKSQSERDYVLGQFRTGRSPILVATDVAARGLDIKDIRVVINYDFPTGVEDYVHRIGRTGRAGATGIAYTFLSDQDSKHARDLIKVLEGANQRVPPEIRDMASRGGGHGKFHRWGSGSTFGGRDSGNGRSDNGYSGRGGRSGGASDSGYGGRGGGSDGSYGGRAGGRSDSGYGGRTGGGSDSGFGGRGGGSDSGFGGRGGGSDSGYGGRTSVGGKGGGSDSRYGSRGGDVSDGGREEADRLRHYHSYHNSHMEASRGYHDSKTTRAAGDRKTGGKSHGRSRSNSPAVKGSHGGMRRSQSRSRSRSRNLGRSPSRQRSHSRSRTRSPSKFAGNGQVHVRSSSSRRDYPPVEPVADRSPPSHAQHHASPPPQHDERPPHSSHVPSSSPSTREEVLARSPFRSADNGLAGVVSPAMEHEGFSAAEGGSTQGGGFTEDPVASSLPNPAEEEEGMIPVDNNDGPAPSDAGWTT